ncbi:MAG TPA: phosphatase PAP2 family protein [Polyangiaceae bacterium]
MSRLAGHVRTLWGPLWFLPLIPTVYALILLPFGELRPEHIVFGVLCPLLGFYGARTKRFFVDVSPYVAVAVAYDLVRYVRPIFVTADRVLGCELRTAELTFFRAGTNTTFQDFFARHHAPFWDLLFAVPYTIFVYLVIVYAGYLYFKDRARMRVYLWAFAVGNFLSFVCWLVFPAAPPWYLRAHGCTIDPNALPNAAALARVDALLGIDYYRTFYSRASSIFGALPSMHCAYPVIGMLSAWRAATWRTRPLHIAYAAVMAFAAVYLDHHWVLDVLAGWLVAIVAVFVARRLVARLGAGADEPVAALVPDEAARPSAIPAPIGDRA